MKETEWAKMVANKLDRALSGFNVEAGKRLIYANEIVEYGENSTSYNEMAYETDILVYEKNKDNSWKPRVVIETKINSVTTNDSITYSQKSATHKYVHPYLRYGIFLGHRGIIHFLVAYSGTALILTLCFRGKITSQETMNGKHCYIS